MSNGDDTELGIHAITKNMDPKEKIAAARTLRRNAMVSKVLVRGTIIILTSILAAIGADFGGLINIMGGE